MFSITSQPRTLVLFLSSLVAIAFFSSCSGDSSFDKAAADAEIRTVYDNSMAAWNNRDMAGYMHMYWNSEKFRTISGDQAYEGWQDALDMSVSSDPEGTYMDPTFTDVFELDVLNDTTAIGFILWRTENENTRTTGASTDIWKKKVEGWRIVHSHISYSH